MNSQSEARPDAAAGLAPLSRVIARGGMVAISDVAPDPLGDAPAQMRQVLERLERLLESAGTGKSRILTAQVRLSDLSLFDAHDAAWREWIDRDHPPLRVLSRAKTQRPGALIEMSVTAAR